MDTIRVAMVAFQDAPEDVFKTGILKLEEFFPNWEVVNATRDLDCLFVLTGGSEARAKQLLDGRPIVIFAQTGGNSFAAAMEILAYCQNQGIRARLVNLDMEDALETNVPNLVACIRALRQLQSSRVGLLGEVSNWLISSEVDAKAMQTRFGMELIQVPWTHIPDFQSYPVNSQYMAHFNLDKETGQDSSRVYNLILDIINKHKLDAITVECFPMVKERGVTACLALSKQNAAGFPAGCEGDLVSLIGKLVVKEMTGQVPWMANLINVDTDSVLLAHCTIGTHLVSDFSITTHFETGVGTAIRGDFTASAVTLLRLDQALTKVFLAEGEVLERPKRKDACRTQVKIGLSPDHLRKLKETPLGNHHLVVPGHLKKLFSSFFELAGMESI